MKARHRISAWFLVLPLCLLLSACVSCGGYDENGERVDCRGDVGRATYYPYYHYYFGYPYYPLYSYYPFYSYYPYNYWMYSEYRSIPYRSPQYRNNPRAQNGPRLAPDRNRGYGRNTMRGGGGGGGYRRR
jgi:hypothetical protein